MSRSSAIPGHLSEAMRGFFRQITRRYALSPHHRRLLIAACESWDRMVEARLLIAQAGLTVENRHGEVRMHPAVQIERDSRTAFARMLRELGLADEVDDPRPPLVRGRYKGRD